MFLLLAGAGCDWAPFGSSDSEEQDGGSDGADTGTNDGSDGDADVDGDGDSDGDPDGGGDGDADTDGDADSDSDTDSDTDSDADADADADGDADPPRDACDGADSCAELALEIFDAINVARATEAEGACDGAPYRWSAPAAEGATEHSAYMASLDEITVERADGTSFLFELDDRGVDWQEGSGWVDDLTGTVEDAMADWLEPGGTRFNVLSCQFGLVGVGVAPSADGLAYVTVIVFLP